MLNLPTNKLVWLNVYFPGDPGCQNFNETELLETLAGIRWIFENTRFDSCLLSGDMNCNFSKNTRFTALVSEFIDSYGLQKIWTNFNNNFMYSSPNNSTFTTIDHFLHNRELHIYKDAGVFYLGDNFSGHSPIFLELATGQLPQKHEQEKLFRPRQNWSKVTMQDKSNYCFNLKDKLNDLKVPDSISQCCDLHCQDEQHRVDIDKYINEIISSIESSCQDNIPYTGSEGKPKNSASKRKVIPGWTELVEPYKTDA